MAGFIAPYSKSFAERLERIKEIRQERDSSAAVVEGRHRGQPLVFSREQRGSNKDLDISRFGQLLPGASATAERALLSRSTTDTILASLSAKIAGDVTKEPVWQRLCTPRRGSIAPPREAPKRSQRFWLPNGRAGTQTHYYEEMADVRSRSPHKRNNRSGSKKLAVTRRFKVAERRRSSCGVRPIAVSPPHSPSKSPSQSQTQTPRLASPRASTPVSRSSSSQSQPREAAKLLMIPVCIQYERPMRSVHAIVACRPASSRGDLLECLASQLHVSCPGMVGSKALREARSADQRHKPVPSSSSTVGASEAQLQPPLVIASDVVLYGACGYSQQPEGRYSLRDKTVPEYPFSARSKGGLGVDGCSKIVVHVKAELGPAAPVAAVRPSEPSRSNIT